MIVQRYKIRECLREFEDYGIVVERTNGGHLKIILPGVAPIVMPSTPGDYHTIANVRAAIRRALRKHRQVRP